MSLWVLVVLTKLLVVYLSHFYCEMAKGIPFETEAQLRELGTSKTPDVLFSSPLGVETPRSDDEGSEWKVVCWIDSKVRFCSFFYLFMPQG